MLNFSLPVLRSLGFYMRVFAVLCFFRETRGIIKDTLEPAKSFKGGQRNV